MFVSLLIFQPLYLCSQRRSKTMPRSRSVPFSHSTDRSPTPASSPSPSVSTQDEEDSDVNITSRERCRTPTNLIAKISPPRPISLNIKPEAGCNVVAKVDREQQTPIESQTASSNFPASHLHLRFADESSSVIQAGITPPEDGSSVMSASDFRVMSPTKACVESVTMSMTPPSSTISPVRRPNYLYGRPIQNVQQQQQISTAVVLGVNSEVSSNSTINLKTTNLPLPILSDDLNSTTEAESEDSTFPPPPMTHSHHHQHQPHPHHSARHHHAHYGHHSHFHHSTEVSSNSLGTCSKLPTIYSGPPTTSENNTETDSEVEEEEEDNLHSSSSDCGECCGGHAPVS